MKYGTNGAMAKKRTGGSLTIQLDGDEDEGGEILLYVPFRKPKASVSPRRD
jgi:hypothetical protein